MTLLDIVTVLFKMYGVLLVTVLLIGFLGAVIVALFSK